MKCLAVVIVVCLSRITFTDTANSSSNLKIRDVNNHNVRYLVVRVPREDDPPQEKSSGKKQKPKPKPESSQEKRKSSQVRLGIIKEKPLSSANSAPTTDKTHEETSKPANNSPDEEKSSGTNQKVKNTASEPVTPQEESKTSPRPQVGKNKIPLKSAKSIPPAADTNARSTASANKPAEQKYSGQNQKVKHTTSQSVASQGPIKPSQSSQSHINRQPLSISIATADDINERSTLPVNDPSKEKSHHKKQKVENTEFRVAIPYYPSDISDRNLRSRTSLEPSKLSPNPYGRISRKPPSSTNSGPTAYYRTNEEPKTLASNYRPEEKSSGIMGAPQKEETVSHSRTSFEQSKLPQATQGNTDRTPIRRGQMPKAILANMEPTSAANIVRPTSTTGARPPTPAATGATVVKLRPYFSQHNMSGRNPIDRTSSAGQTRPLGRVNVASAGFYDPLQLGPKEPFKPGGKYFTYLPPR